MRLTTTLALAAVCAAAPAAHAQTQTFVDFSSEYTQRLQSLHADYAAVPASGIFTTAGNIRFNVGLGAAASGNNIWNANFDGPDGGAGTRTLDLAVNIPNPTAVYTLLNSWWGSTTPGIAKVEFFGTNGAYLEKTLVGGTDVRDFYQNVWTNTINGTTTVNVFAAGPVRLDRMAVDLSSAFAGERLTGIRFTDSGGWVQQRLMVSGVTVESVSVSAVPEPATVALVAGGLAVIGVAARRRTARA